LMPLESAPLSYFDTVNGYALRPNRPAHAPGATPPVQTDMTRDPAQTPFCETLQFYGCVDLSGAKYYRFLQSTDGGVSFPAITGQAWNNFTGVGAAIPITADVNGWYPVNPINPATLSPVSRSTLWWPTFLLNWPTPYLDKSLLKIEIGDASKAHIGFSAIVAIQTDNQAPDAPFTTLSWKFKGDDDSTLQSLLGISCPMIKRGATPRDIEIVFEVSVSANHLRDASISASGCGGASFSLVSTDPLNKPYHWHTNVLDNSVLLHQRFALAADTLPGCYSFGCTAYSRAMNPDGRDNGESLPTDWYEDTWVIGVSPSIPVAVVNED
jgi:hypothetical protein